MKIVKSLEESGLLIKAISETIKENKKWRFLPISLGTLAASLLISALTGRGVVRAGKGVIRTDKSS